MLAPRLVIAGTHSGVGKTTVAVGLCAALRGRGLAVAPFKVGPDYIDPAYAGAVCDRPCRNLDGWMGGGDVGAAFARGARGAGVSIVEGMMGLFDGRSADGDAGSTAEVARALAAPIVLVIDASAMARSAAALVSGFANFAPGVRLAGVIANRVGGPGHAGLLRTAIEGACGVPLLGALPSDPEVRIPERHLGLVPVAENPALPGVAARLAQRVGAGCDLNRLLALARTAPALSEPPPAAPRRAGAVRIGYALDAAFHFYYPENLERLEEAGAELVPFSPLTAPRLPEGLGGLYLGGGFPEAFAAELGANVSLGAAVRAAVADGLPIYAECGGLMWLSRHIEDLDGRRHAQVGVLPVGVRMTRGLAAFGYREVEALADTLVLPAGGRARGHEFHHSELAGEFPAGEAAYRVRGRPGEGLEGLRRPGLIASYVHLHFGSNPAIAPRFVAACAAWRPRR